TSASFAIPVNGMISGSFTVANFFIPASGGRHVFRYWGVPSFQRDMLHLRANLAKVLDYNDSVLRRSPKVFRPVYDQHLQALRTTARRGQGDCGGAEKNRPGNVNARA